MLADKALMNFTISSVSFVYLVQCGKLRRKSNSPRAFFFEIFLPPFKTSGAGLRTNFVRLA